VIITCCIEKVYIKVE